MIIITQARARIHIQNHTTHTYTHIYTQKEREGERKRDEGRESYYISELNVFLFLII